MDRWQGTLFPYKPNPEQLRLGAQTQHNQRTTARALVETVYKSESTNSWIYGCVSLSKLACVLVMNKQLIV